VQPSTVTQNCSVSFAENSNVTMMNNEASSIHGGSIFSCNIIFDGSCMITFKATQNGEGLYT